MTLLMNMSYKINKCEMNSSIVVGICVPCLGECHQKVVDLLFDSVDSSNTYVLFLLNQVLLPKNLDLYGIICKCLKDQLRIQLTQEIICLNLFLFLCTSGMLTIFVDMQHKIMINNSNNTFQYTMIMANQ